MPSLCDEGGEVERFPGYVGIIIGILGLDVEDRPGESGPSVEDDLSSISLSSNFVVAEYSSGNPNSAVSFLKEMTLFVDVVAVVVVSMIAEDDEPFATADSIVKSSDIIL